MKYRAVFSLLLALPGTAAVSADFGFNPTVAAYVAIPLGARTETSFTNWGLRFGEIDTSGYYDERIYSPLNDVPTLSRYMSHPALWELRSDRWGISSFMVNGLETAERSYTLNAAGAVTAAASSINWGMVAAGTAATVAVVAASSSSSGNSGSGNNSSPGTSQPAPRTEDDHRGNDHHGNDHHGNDHRGNDHRGNDHRGNDHRGNDHRGDDHRGNDHRGDD